MAEKRLFIALWPDDRQRNTLRDLLQPLLGSLEGKLIDRRNWHVTLVFIGNVPEERVPALVAAISAVQVKPFRLRFDRLNFWPRPKIACLQASIVPDELKCLKADLEAALQPLGVEPEALEYRPHVTTARAVRPFETIRLARPLEMQWTSVQLVESVSAVGGAQYHPMKQ